MADNMPWCRLYGEMLNDPKVQTLPDKSFKLWINCLCLATKSGGNLGTIQDIAFAFRETVESVSSAFHPLLERALLVTLDETFHVAKWSKRQYKSDTSTERVKRFRKRERNVTETAPDTDTDTERKKEDAYASSKENSDQPEIEVKNGKRGTRLPVDWQPSPTDTEFANEWGVNIEVEAASFRDYWHGKPGAGGVKLDWPGTWRNWCRKAGRTPGTGGRSSKHGSNRRGTGSILEAAQGALAELEKRRNLQR